MMTVFCPSGTSSVTPSRTRLAPKALVRPWSSITARATERPEPAPPPPSSQQDQRPEGVQHQDRLATEHHRPRRALAHALRAALGIEPAEATHECHGRAEAGALDQAEPDVLEPVELLEALEELGSREVEQVD